MKYRLTQLILGVVVLFIVIFVTSFKLPYYIYQPGNAQALDPLVELEGGVESEGDMHLVTVRGGQATIAYYLWAKIRPYYQIYPLEEIRPEGISQEEYNHIQLEYMDSSQDAAIAVAFEAANKEIDYEYVGTFVVDISDNMPAAEVFKVGDQIISIDDQMIEQASDITTYVQNKNENDLLKVEFIRDSKTMQDEIRLAPFPDKPDTVGMGISLITERNVITNPIVKFNSGDIGGPSAGLMFTLEIYDQLTEMDYTKGHQICGTGTISLDGSVGRIGGIDKKVVASDKDGCDIFFAPNENGSDDSNYMVAKKTAEEIETKMKIIPVDYFSDAVQFLEKLESKN